MNDEVERLLESYVEDSFDRNPHIATVLGVHSHDDELPDGGRAAVEEEIEATEDLLDDVRGHDGFEAELAEAALEYDVYEMDELRLWEQDPMAVDALYSFVFPVFADESRSMEARMEDVADRLEGVPGYLEEVRGRVVEPKEVFVDREIDACEEVAPLLQVVADAAGDLERQDVSYSVNSAAEDVVEAFDEHEEWLRGLDADEGWRVGEDALAELFELRMIPEPGDVVDLAERELARAEEEMSTAVDAADGGAEQAVEEIEQDVPAPNDVVAEYAEQVAKARTEAKEVVPLPESAGVEVVETPEYLAPLVPLVNYSGPEPYGDSSATYYVTRPKSNQTLKEHSRPEIAGRAVGDLYPGHHVQQAYACEEAHRATALLGWFNSFGDDLVGGWRDHAERMMDERGFHPDLGLVRSRNRVAAACRARVDVLLQTGEMSVREAATYLVEQAGMESEAAVQEVRSYASDPGSQVSRVVGATRIRGLWSDSETSLEEFNRRLLAHGGVPLEMVADQV